MAGATIGTAYIQILPSAQGIKGNLQSLFGGDAEQAGYSIGGRLGNGILGGLKGIGTAIGAMVAAGAGAAIAVGKQALSTYKDYEQLSGGAELLWGNAYASVAKNASEAYKTVQMSQNDYLRQVNGFATGLKNALGGNEKAAADLANRIVQAQADVVAATGATQESVQNAFNGIMRGNFTMVDNLQLGITPTKKGYQDMIKQVNAWNKAQGKSTKYQMGNLADMEAALVDYIEMQGLSGYAQQEAANTIEGALASTKSAWSNLLAGLADDNADLDSLITNMIDSAMNLADLIMPRISTIMEGFTTLLGQALPEIVPVITQFITDNSGTLADAGIQIFTAILTGFVSAIPSILDALPQIWESLKLAFEENAPQLETAAWQAFLTVGRGINSALDGAGQYIQAHFGEWVAYAGFLAQDFGATVSSSFSALATEVGGWINDYIITPAKDAVKGLVSVGTEVVNSIKEGISNAWSGLTTWFKNLFNSLFGNLNANITVTGKKAGDGAGEYATGLDYVPYDEFPAILHKGEAVLTASEANLWRNGMSGGMTINQYIQSVPQTPVQLAAATEAQFELARWAL